MSQTRWALRFVPCLGMLVACGTDQPAGKGLSADAGSDSRTVGDGSKPLRRRDSAVRPRPEASAPVCEMPVAPRGDAQSPASCADAGAVSQSDSGTPPTHCVAPCVWELMKHCRPRGECTQQVYSYEFRVHGETASCAPENDWWSLERFDGGISDTHYFVDGCLCYELSTLTVSSSGSGALTLWAKWLDAANRLIAFNGDYPRGPVTCGPYVSDPNEAVEADGGMAPGFTEYPQDPDNPDCAPWREPVCRRGCCPTNPPRLP